MSGGGPPFIRLGKRRIIYRRADVEAWLLRRTFASLAEEAAGRTAYPMADRDRLPQGRRRRADEPTAAPVE